jgi:hypothetical protein
MRIQCEFFDYICFKCMRLDFTAISPYIMISVIDSHLMAPYVDRIVQLKLIQLLGRPDDNTLDSCFNIINSFEKLNLFNVVHFKTACLKLCFERFYETQRYQDSNQVYLYINYLTRNNDQNDNLYERFYTKVNELGYIPDEFYEITNSHSLVETQGARYINQNIEFMQNLIKLSHAFAVKEKSQDYSELDLEFIKIFFEKYMATGRIARSIYLFAYLMFEKNFNDQFYKIISRDTFHLAKGYSSHFSGNILPITF